jgi:glutathione S-transferase
MKLTLYYAPIACSLVPLITLNESGAPFDVHTVLLAKGQQKTPEYLKLNPKGKVPALAIDGEVLTENVAILSLGHPSASGAGQCAAAVLRPSRQRGCHPPSGG